MHEGVDVEPSKTQKDELLLMGNSLENVSQSAADIQQTCRVRNKDIRKVRYTSSYISLKPLFRERLTMGTLWYKLQWPEGACA